MLVVEGSVLTGILYCVTNHYRDTAGDFVDVLGWWAAVFEAQCRFHLTLILHRSRHSSPLWKARFNRMHLWHILRNGGKHFYFLSWLPKTLELTVISTAAKRKAFFSWPLADPFFDFHEFSPSFWLWHRFCSPWDSAFNRKLNSGRVIEWL